MMRVRRCGHVVIAAHDAHAPSDEEWDACIALLRSLGRERRVLVYSEGGVPGAAQRKRFSEAASGTSTRVAVMQDSRVLRMVTTALAWLGVPIRTFGLHDQRGALDFLALRGDEERDVLRALAEMTDELHTGQGARA